MVEVNAAARCLCAALAAVLVPAQEPEVALVRRSLERRARCLRFLRDAAMEL